MARGGISEIAMAICVVGFLLLLLMLRNLWKLCRAHRALRRDAADGVGGSEQLRPGLAGPLVNYGTTGTTTGGAAAWFAVCGDGDVSVNVETDRSCSRCDAPEVRDVSSPRYLLLPCRCEWCACGAKDASTDGLARYTAANGSSRCTRCSTSVTAVVDLYQLHMDVGGHKSSAEPSLRSFGRLHSTVFDAPDCCICMSEPSCVAALPCGHLCACVDCGHRLAEDISVLGRDAATGAAEVGGRCPLCRATLRSMIVLDDVQLAAAVRAVGKR